MVHLKFIDLFCGIGSFHYSFMRRGWECVMACDINPVVKKTYQRNFGMVPLGDICKIDPNSVLGYDLLCAGFPCQPFSQIGHGEGFEDKRGTLFYQIMRFAEHHHPRFIVLENVPALLTHDDGNTFLTIRDKIVAAGYKLGKRVLNCRDYGIPQNRKRLFMVGVRNDVEVDPDSILELDKFRKTSNLKDFLGRDFERETAFTLRCGGRRSPIDDRHNWDGYLVDGQEYRLSVADGLKLQGFGEEFILEGSETEQWRQIGNTIPTIFTDIIASRLEELLETNGEVQATING